MRDIRPCSRARRWPGARRWPKSRDAVVLTTAPRQDPFVHAEQIAKRDRACDRSGLHAVSRALAARPAGDPAPGSSGRAGRGRSATGIRGSGRFVGGRCSRVRESSTSSRGGSKISACPVSWLGDDSAFGPPTIPTSPGGARRHRLAQPRSLSQSATTWRGFSGRHGVIRLRKNPSTVRLARCSTHSRAEAHCSTPRSGR